MSYEILLLIGLGLLVTWGIWASVSRSADGPEVGDTYSAYDDDKAPERKHWLVGKKGASKDKVYHVGQRTVTIGRKPSNFIQIQESEVSRVHCRLQWSPQGMVISDLDSSLGTEVESEPIASNKPKPLSDGDTIAIGPAEFTYRETADFDTNYEFIEQNEGGEQYEAITTVNGQAEWRRAILAEIERADGDLEVAASNIGLEPDAFERLMEQQGIDPAEAPEDSSA